MSKKIKIVNKDGNKLMIKNQIGDTIMANIDKLYNSVKKNDEFEFILFSKKGKYLSQEKYIEILKYFNNKVTGTNKLIGPIDTLELLYNITDEIVIRCSIENAATINVYMKNVSLFKNHVIFSTFVKLWQKGDKKIHFMKKTKTTDNTIDIDDLNMRVRLSKENDLTKEDIDSIKNLDDTKMSKIVYRYKQRTSLFVLGDTTSENYIRIDLTLTKTTNNFKKLNTTITNYELEVEYGSQTKNLPETLDKILYEIQLLFKIVQQSNYVITNSVANNVLQAYRSILMIDDKNSTALDGRQPISLEIQHITENLPNKYAVTDKADGDRYFLIIVNLKVYLISSNLNVKDTGITIDKTLEKYNNSILDGEFIFLLEHNRHIYLAFDCLFCGNLDVRKSVSLFERLKYADEIIEKCFVFGEQKGNILNKDEKQEKGNFDFNKHIQKQQETIELYMYTLNNDILLEKQIPLVRRKLFIGCLGIKNWEIFIYSVLLWNAYTKNATINCPYLLDGLIYQPLEQAYIANSRESQKTDYKWKPPNKNSIDFYIEFEKDSETNKILTVYDNSNEEYVRNKSYKICNLHVGEKTNEGEHPVLFKQDQELYLAYLFLDNNEARDIDGNILSDKTVVEFYYNNDENIPERFKWVPIKTRYDKTEAVIRFGKKYGNYGSIADKIWRSITNPILISDFEDLSVGNEPSKNIYNYDKKLEMMRKKIGHDLIITAAKENVYYQQRTNLAKPMRQFHNWIKSNMIYIVCHPMFQNNKQLTILDIACGRGGEIMKWFHAKASFVVGIDIDKEGLTSAVDGCASRYAQQRKRPNFPKMYFIQADAGALLNLEDQSRALSGMSNDNKQLLDKFFSKDEKKRTMFDRITCFFAVHYMLKDETTWANLKQNINMYLRNGGFFMITTFDSKKIEELLGDNDRYKYEYTDDLGKKKTLFEIVKKYVTGQKDSIRGTGNAIDVYMAWISQEGNYLTEYLVDKRFIEKELLESCDLELVDSDNFGNQRNIHKDFFENYAKYEEKDETKKFLGNVKEFYKLNEVNNGCFVYNTLMRYYIFRKKEPEHKKQTGGKIAKEVKYDFGNTQQFTFGNMDEYNNEYSCFNSIHQLLKSHQIIPENVNPNELFNDFGIKIVSDKDFKTSSLTNLGKKILIEHDVNDKKKVVVDGMNIFVVERNCNDEYITDSYVTSKNNKAIILMRDGDLYTPIYQKLQDGNHKGIFKMSEPLIKWMQENE
jgi:hypothetical protein